MASTNIKPVSFNTEKDSDIIDYLENVSEGFAPYVKRLIREDMNKGKAVEPTPDTTQSDIKELISLMKQMLQNGMMMPNMAQMMQYQMMLQGGNVTQGTTTPPEPPEEKEDEISDAQKEALMNIKNMFKSKK